MWRQQITAIQTGYAHVGKERLLAEKIIMKIVGDEFPISPKFLCSHFKAYVEIKVLKKLQMILSSSNDILYMKML